MVWQEVFVYGVDHAGHPGAQTEGRPHPTSYAVSMAVDGVWDDQMQKSLLDFVEGRGDLYFGVQQIAFLLAEETFGVGAH